MVLMKDLIAHVALFQKKYALVFLVVALVAAGGIYLTLKSHAATPYASVDAASGSIAGSGIYAK